MVHGELSREITMLSKDKIREIFLANGFTVKDGQTDLRDYVFEAAAALIDEAMKAGAPALTSERINDLAAQHYGSKATAQELGFARAVEGAVLEEATTGSAEEYLRKRYGSYRGHHEWRALEDAFNAGRASNGA